MRDTYDQLHEVFLSQPPLSFQDLPFHRKVLVKLRKMKSFAIEQIKHHYYVITTNGLGVSKKRSSKWQTKWEKPSTLKILMVAPNDYAGSFYGWAKAVNHYSKDVACRNVSLFKHRYNYDYDYIFHSFANGFQNHIAFKKLVDEADGLHLKDEFYFYKTGWRPSVSEFITSLIQEFKRKNKPIIFTHYGSLARRFQNEPAYQTAVLEFDARIALTPDLNFNWFSGSYIPHAVDISKFPYLWSESKIFAHSPSEKTVKGTDIMMKAIKNIPEIKNTWRVDLIENVKNKECLARKSQSELFFDQAGIDDRDQTVGSRVTGWYGNSAVEAMAYGIPTIAHLSEISFIQSKNAGKDIRNVCPILNTGLDEESMQQTVSNYLNLSETEKKELSKKTRQWVEEFHGENVVGKELAAIYKQSIQS